MRLFGLNFPNIERFDASCFHMNDVVKVLERPLDDEKILRGDKQMITFEEIGKNNGVRDASLISARSFLRCLRDFPRKIKQRPTLCS
jgi:hypothetical protein